MTAPAKKAPTFKVGDRVQVNPQYTFFTVTGELVVEEVTPGNGNYYYRTEPSCPVHGPFQGHELVPA